MRRNCRGGAPVDLQHKEVKMETSRYASCIEACNDCADACDMCASACLHEEDIKMMARCIALDVDCSQLCRLAASVMARNGEAAQAICATCAEVCEMCAAECARHQQEHCQRCAAACRRCAAECRQMGGMPAAGQGFGMPAPH
jgi:hypothetical protein